MKNKKNWVQTHNDRVISFGLASNHISPKNNLGKVNHYISCFLALIETENNHSNCEELFYNSSYIPLSFTVIQWSLGILIVWIPRPPTGASLSKQILSKIVRIQRPYLCSDTAAPWHPNFDSCYPNSGTKTPSLVIHYPNKFYPNYFGHQEPHPCTDTKTPV